jgi:hypothetical protein
MENKKNGVPEKLEKAERFVTENSELIKEFLDSNGYTAREVRGIALRAIALWETQQKS